MIFITSSFKSFSTQLPTYCTIPCHLKPGVKCFGQIGWSSRSISWLQMCFTMTPSWHDPCSLYLLLVTVIATILQPTKRPHGLSKSLSRSACRRNFVLQMPHKSVDDTVKCMKMLSDIISSYIVEGNHVDHESKKPKVRNKQHFFVEKHTEHLMSYILFVQVNVHEWLTGMSFQPA